MPVEMSKLLEGALLQILLTVYIQCSFSDMRLEVRYKCWPIMLLRIDSLFMYKRILVLFVISILLCHFYHLIIVTTKKRIQCFFYVGSGYQTEDFVCSCL